MISVYGLSLASKIEILGYPQKSPYGFSVISAQLFDYFNRIFGYLYIALQL
jgi:hypothetical protein